MIRALAKAITTTMLITDFILKPARLRNKPNRVKARILALESNRESRRNLVASSLILDGANNVPDKFKIFSSHGNLLVSVYIS